MPATSVCLAVKVCEPLVSALLAMLQLPEPSAVVEPSRVLPSVSYSLTAALASAWPVTVGVLSLVMPSPKVPLSLPLFNAKVVGAAAMVSIVTDKPVLSGEVLLPESVCVTFSV